MGVPILDRLNFRDYQALFIGFTFLAFETLLRVITWCLPTVVLELYERTSPAIILQHAITFKEMAAHWGYTTEDHIVLTRDQYILGIHRIPHGKSEINLNDDDNNANNIQTILQNGQIPISAVRNTSSNLDPFQSTKPVVLMYHGFMMCSDVWMCNLEEERRLACLLADAGYDVWFGNCRGNKYSMKHARYKPSGRRFWEYSMDECALYDLPDTIDYILETTGASSLSYIGFSQGTALQFAALSVSPKLNKKVNLFIALAPATRLRNPIVDAFIKASPTVIFLFFGRKAFLTMTLFWQKVLSPPIFTKILDTSMNFLFGWEGKNMTEAQKAVSYNHLYSLASVKSLVHWFQIMRASNFQMYDDLPPYSSKGSITHGFPTKQIKTPIAVFYGGSDSLVDIDMLLKQLPKPVLVKKVEKYEHLDFLWASEVHEEVFPDIFKLLRNYNPHSTEDF
ncbi:7438_t:CDS:2 [Ambispora leptoticha]|uniref:7438_t:CDS:1 n=1 Tax=Ambispora leptoticha TaxID=144679 RepID=A0A9N8V1J1_9GLOM|nr:7438_t:CDS:2 [Ambispora leptoticha]